MGSPCLNGSEQQSKSDCIVHCFYDFMKNCYVNLFIVSISQSVGLVFNFNWFEESFPFIHSRSVENDSEISILIWTKFLLILLLYVPITWWKLCLPVLRSELMKHEVTNWHFTTASWQTDTFPSCRVPNYCYTFLLSNFHCYSEFKINTVLNLGHAIFGLESLFRWGAGLQLFWKMQRRQFSFCCSWNWTSLAWQQGLLLFINTGKLS